jgi:Big-like domain-containing protein
MSRRRRSSAPVLRGAVALVLACLLGACTLTTSVWAAFSATTAAAGSSITAAPDWVAPQVTMLDPGSPLSGVASLNATATDAGSGVSTVTIQRSTAGAGAWSAVCTDSTAPYNCALDTAALADGAYDLRAIARDVAGNSRTSNVVSARVFDNFGPAVTLAPIASDVRLVIALSATATDDGTGIASVRIERSLADLDTWTTICTDATSPYSCSLDTRTLADDIYDFRAVAVDRAANSTVSDLQAGVQLDNTAPTGVAITAPSPLRGAATLTVAADDVDSGVATVTLQRSKAGLNTFTDICVTTSYPYSCAFLTTAGATPDGSYDLRAVAVDAAGNATTSAIVTRLIDNAQPSVSVADPGAFLRGTVVVQANAYAGNGVTQVAIQRATAGGSTYTTICTDASTPYSCSWDTTTVTGGSYDLRAVMTYGTGQTLTSAVMAARVVDNAAVTGYDVQAVNRVGGSAGKLGIGDTVDLTWSRQMNTTSLLPGWSGTGTANLTVRLVDGATTGINTGSGADALQLLDAAGNAGGLGTINLKANYVKSKKTAVFAATATQSTVTIAGTARTVMRITLGNITSGGSLRSAGGTPVMAWAPSATARDTLGNLASPAPINELGVADRDF